MEYFKRNVGVECFNRYNTTTGRVSREDGRVAGHSKKNVVVSRSMSSLLSHSCIPLLILG